MFGSIKEFFTAHLELEESATVSQQEHAIRLATAALLFEVSRADFAMGAEEQQSISLTLRRQFGLEATELDELMNLARSEVEASISMYQFTGLINDSYDYSQKLRLIESMWQVAFADGELDKYEDYLIRKVADLIYVSHTDFIQRKLKVQSQIETS